MRKLPLLALLAIIGCNNPTPEKYVTPPAPEIPVIQDTMPAHIAAFEARQKIVYIYTDSAAYYFGKESDAMGTNKVHEYYLQLKRCTDSVKKYNY